MDIPCTDKFNRQPGAEKEVSTAWIRSKFRWQPCVVMALKNSAFDLLAPEDSLE